jgi:isoleucyl-tRNA synthetase
VVIDTTLTDELRAEGDARELQRAIQDARRAAGLDLVDRIDVWLAPGTDGDHRLAPFLEHVAAETLARDVHHAEPPRDAWPGEVAIEGGSVRFAIRRADSGGPARAVGEAEAVG